MARGRAGGSGGRPQPGTGTDADGVWCCHVSAASPSSGSCGQAGHALVKAAVFAVVPAQDNVWEPSLHPEAAVPVLKQEPDCRPLLHRCTAGSSAGVAILAP